MGQLVYDEIFQIRKDIETLSAKVETIGDQNNAIIDSLGQIYGLLKGTTTNYQQDSPEPSIDFEFKFNSEDEIFEFNQKLEDEIYRTRLVRISKTCFLCDRVLKLLHIFR